MPKVTELISSQKNQNAGLSDPKFLTAYYTALFSSGGFGHSSHIQIIGGTQIRYRNFSLLSPPSSLYQSNDMTLSIPAKERDG